MLVRYLIVIALFAHGVGHLPFGGYKPDSGIGREGLGYSIDECTVLKTVVMPG